MQPILSPDTSSSDTISTQLFDVVSSTRDAKPYVFSGSSVRIRAFSYSTPKKRQSLLSHVVKVIKGPRAQPLSRKHFAALGAAGWVSDDELEIVDRMRDKQGETL